MKQKKKDYLIRGIFYLGISIFLGSCSLEQDSDIQTNEQMNINFENVKTVSFKDAREIFNNKIRKLEEKRSFKKNEHNKLNVSPSWNTLKHNAVAYTNAKLTAAETIINREGNYTSQVCFLNVNNVAKSVILTTWNDKLDATGNLINGKLFFNDLDGTFIDGYRIENGLFVTRYVKTKQIQESNLFSFLFFQELERCWPSINNFEITLNLKRTGGYGEVFSPSFNSNIISWNNYGSYVNAATNSSATSWNSLPNNGGANNSLSKGQLNSAAGAILIASTVKPDEDGKCPEGFEKSSTSDLCEPICNTGGKIFNSNTKNCECPEGTIVDKEGVCLPKPCNGDPILNPEIAPQTNSGIAGGLHGTCARRNSAYVCKGIKGRKYHNGVDIKNPYGEPIHAIYDGKATIHTQRNKKTNKISGAGHYTSIISNVNGKKIRMVYFHLQEKNRITGNVKTGDIIGYQGDSGNLKSGINQGYTTSHVHIKTQVNGSNANPLNHFKTKIDPKTGKTINKCQ